VVRCERFHRGAWRCAHPQRVCSAFAGDYDDDEHAPHNAVGDGEEPAPAVPAPLAEAGDGLRTEGGHPRPFFREEPADSSFETPEQMLKGLVQLNKEIASFLFPIQDLKDGFSDLKTMLTGGGREAAAPPPSAKDE